MSNPADIGVAFVKVYAWNVIERVLVYAALLAFCVLCWWGFFALMFRLFGG